MRHAPPVIFLVVCAVLGLARAGAAQQSAPPPLVLEGPTNTAVGQNALAANTTGIANTAVGVEALFSNTTGFYNTSSGFNAMSSNTDGFQNTASGAFALYYNQVGGNNTAYGAFSLLDTTGSLNTAVGLNSGVNLTTGDYNLMLGAEVYGEPTDTKTIRIGLADGAHGPGTGQNRTFIAGVHGTQLTGPAVQVFVDANGQLGTLTAPIVSGTGAVGPSAAAPQVEELLQTIVELRKRLERLEALVTAGPRRK